MDFQRYPGIGERLRAYRVGLGLSADEAASRLGISRTALYRYERGEPPKLPTLERAAMLLDVPLGTLLGVSAEWFSSPATLFDRVRLLEETAEHIFILFGTGSFLLTTDSYDEILPSLVEETLPSGIDPAPLLRIIRQRKETYRQRQPSMVSLLSMPEIWDLLRDGAAVPAFLKSEAARARWRNIARAQIERLAELAEAPPRGLQIGVLERVVTTTGFSMTRGRGETHLITSPFRLGSKVSLAGGIAMITRAPDAVRLHNEVADGLWHESVKGERAARLLRDALAGCRPGLDDPAAVNRKVLACHLA